MPCVCSRGSAHVHGRGAGYVREVRERDEVSSAAGREHPAPAVTGRGHRAKARGPPGSGRAQRRRSGDWPWGLGVSFAGGVRSNHMCSLVRGRCGPTGAAGARPSDACGTDLQLEAGRGGAGLGRTRAAPAPAPDGWCSRGGPAAASLGSCAFSVPIRGGGGGEVTGSHLWLQMRPRAARHPSRGWVGVQLRSPTFRHRDRCSHESLRPEDLRRS